MGLDGDVMLGVCFGGTIGFCVVLGCGVCFGREIGFCVVEIWGSVEEVEVVVLLSGNIWLSIYSSCSREIS